MSNTWWTKMPNTILEAMPAMSEAELKLTAVLVRETYGRHQSGVKMTYDDMQERTGLSRGGVANAVTAVNNRGFFRRGNKSTWETILVYSVDQTEQVDSLPSELKSIDYSLSSELKSIDYSLSSRPLPIKEKKEKRKKEEDHPPTPQTATAIDSIPFKPLPAGMKGKDPTPAQQRVDVILAVCGLSPDVPAHVRKAENAAAQLAAYDPEVIRKRYTFTTTPNGTWYWYRDDWRGQRGDMPTPEKVLETISVERKPMTAGTTAVNHQPTTPVEQAAARYAALKRSISSERVDH